MKYKPKFRYLLLSLLFSPTLLHAQSPQNFSADGVDNDETISCCDSIGIPSPSELFNSIDSIEITPTLLNKSFIPRIFHGYRSLDRKPIHFPELRHVDGLSVSTYVVPADTILNDEGLQLEDLILDDAVADNEEASFEENLLADQQNLDTYSILHYKKPKWLSDAMTSYRIQEDLNYSYMIKNPTEIEYAYWDLPEPPQLEEEDHSFMGYINRLKLPLIDLATTEIPVEEDVRKIHWLHVFNTGLQFSQAYVSPNWYQGGNDYLALLFNFNWNVKLNQVYHPNWLFQSNLSYKLALNSTPKGDIHKYSISEDNFQYNLNVGLKAVKKWYYSFNLLLKTQFLNNYESDSDVMTAAFLSPGNLNMGLGMSYNLENKYKTLQLTVTISPLSYNLNSCLSSRIDHGLYNMSQNQKFKSEIGSNAELNMTWQMCSFLNYKTRLFLFSDYHYFLTDWENTFNFTINKFLSTQIFVHLRYDSSTENYGRWKRFMMREILSFGLSYTFSTVPK